VHENARQIQLHLKTDINVRSVDCGRPPKRKTTIRNLIQTRSLSICQLFKFHTLFKTRCFFPIINKIFSKRQDLINEKLLPEKTLPSREVSTLKQSMFQNTLDTTKSLNHVRTVIIKIPQFTIVSLMSPPEGIIFQKLILLEISADSPAFIIRKCMAILF
jgi:hypothetical protein